MIRDYAREEWVNWQAIVAYMKQFTTIEEFLSASEPDPNGTRFSELLDDWAVSRVRLLQQTEEKGS
jgi:hypothetical protein